MVVAPAEAALGRRDGSEISRARLGSDRFRDLGSQGQQF